MLYNALITIKRGLQIYFSFLDLFLNLQQGMPTVFELYVYEGKWQMITVQTQIYLCINQLRVSAAQRTIKKP